MTDEEKLRQQRQQAIADKDWKLAAALTIQLDQMEESQS